MPLPGPDADNCAENVKIAENIMAEHGHYIKAVIGCKIKDDASINDLYQEFFLSLIAEPLPKDIKNIQSYLYVRIINDIGDFLRKNRKYETDQKKYLNFFNFSVHKNEPKYASIKEDQIEQVFELAERLLPPAEVKALKLRYKDGESYEKIAAEMDLKKVSVRKYISRGLGKIRRFLGDRKGNNNENI